MAKSRGLGRGFEALIPTEIVEDLPASVAPNSDLVQQIEPSKIGPNPHQPRTHFDEAELRGLADSISHHGILQPLVVSDTGDGKYELVAGERRLRAARIAGLTSVPVIIRSFDEQQKLELALIENLQRANLNPIETAIAYRKLTAEFNLSLDEVSRRMGRAKSTISNLLRLLQLPADVQKAIVSGSISEAHGRAILAISDSSLQKLLLKHIVDDGWTVRQAEAFAREQKATSGEPSQSRRNSFGGRANDLAQKLSSYLKASVSLQPTARGGRIVISYKGDEELQRIISAIQPNQNE